MRLFKNILFLLITLSCLACSFESEGVILDERGEEYELYDYYIDEFGNEGIVVCISDSFVVVMSADESYQSWGPTNEQLYPYGDISENFNRVDYGVAMHQLMKAKGIERYPAQNWCDKKNGGKEYSYAGSWRLPSFKELKDIFGANGAYVGRIQSSLKNIGGTLLNTENMYWTCTEDYIDYVTIKDLETDYDPENRAVITSCLIATLGTKDRWIKKNKHYVRAIKYVYYKE